MLIQLENINNAGRVPLFVHQRDRLATVTSVKFVDRQTIICCSFVGRKMYAVHFDLE